MNQRITVDPSVFVYSVCAFLVAYTCRYWLRRRWSQGPIAVSASISPKTVRVILNNLGSEHVSLDRLYLTRPRYIWRKFSFGFSARVRRGNSLGTAFRSLVPDDVETQVGDDDTLGTGMHIAGGSSHNLFTCNSEHNAAHAWTNIILHGDAQYGPLQIHYREFPWQLFGKHKRIGF